MTTQRPKSALETIVLPACIFLLGVACIGLLAVSCTKTTPSVAPPMQQPSTPPAPVSEAPASAAGVLELAGPGGHRSLTLNEIKALPATEGWAGTKNGSGRIAGPDFYKGVSVAVLADLVGGMCLD